MFTTTKTEPTPPEPKKKKLSNADSYTIIRCEKRSGDSTKLPAIVKSVEKVVDKVVHEEFSLPKIIEPKARTVAVKVLPMIDLDESKIPKLKRDSTFVKESPVGEETKGDEESTRSVSETDVKSRMDSTRYCRVLRYFRSTPASRYPARERKLISFDEKMMMFVLKL